MPLSKKAELLIEEEVLRSERVVALFPNPSQVGELIQRGVLSPEGESAFRVRFVGVAVTGGRSFQVLPKIFGDLKDQAVPIMRQVIRALRRYARWQPKHHEYAPYLDVSARRPELSALAIADWLIRDYLNAGIYRRLRERETLNGTGQLSWRRTIERVAPLLSLGRPVYVDAITRSAARDHEHFVSRLHKQVVEAASRTFGHLLGYAPVMLDHEPFELFGDMPTFSLSQARIRQEMREAFSDRAMQLLPMLLAWLSAVEMTAKVDLALYGVKAFHPIWEEACSLILGNERDKWQVHIPRPEWRSAAGHVQKADTFRPDIVTRIRSQGDEHLLIADAKYYQLSMPPTLDGQPGVNDVAKQLWYERCLAAEARTRGLARTYNVFVVPGPEREGGFWSDGEVSLDGLPETNVKVKRLSGLQALERYADGNPLDPKHVCAVVMAS